MYDQEDYGKEYWKGKSKLEPKHYFLVSDWIKWFMPKTVLDYGCGMGQYVKAFRDMGVKAWGFELSKFARENSEHSDLYSKVVPKEGVNLVICMDVLEHIEEDKVTNILKEIKAVTNDFAVFSICFKEDPNFDLDKTHKTKKTREWWEYQIREAGFMVMNTPKEWGWNWKMIVAKNGLEEIQ